MVDRSPNMRPLPKMATWSSRRVVKTVKIPLKLTEDPYPSSSSSSQSGIIKRDSGITSAAFVTWSKFKSLSLSQLAVTYYRERPNEEQRIRDAIVNICNNPGTGVLVVTGGCGVGKSTLVARVLATDDDGDETSAVLHQPTNVLWANCSSWKDGELSVYDKAAFQNELVKEAKLFDPRLGSITAADIIPYFLKKSKTPVLFVLDSLFNTNLLQHFYDIQHDKSLLSCCVITQNAYLPKIERLPFIDKIERLDPLNGQFLLKKNSDS